VSTPQRETALPTARLPSSMTTICTSISTDWNRPTMSAGLRRPYAERHVR